MTRFRTPRGACVLLVPAALAAVADPIPAQQLDSTAFHALEWRFIGPYRGGRATAVAGIPGPDHRLTYYHGATGGGVWKSDDAGLSWRPLTDSTAMAGSIGAIAVAPSDPNVVYVGTGEEPPRGNVSPGNGMWKSTDGGATWARAGLEDAGQIAHIHVDPRNADLVYAAAMGHIFGPSETRGVFRSRDGGATWQRVLYRDANSGGVSLAVDPGNPRVMYAAMWQVRRSPWALESGGPGSGLFKTTDGGDAWTEITRNEGLPEGAIGKIGVTVSGGDSRRVWAIVEAEEGGVFRSDNGGRTWRRTNSDRSLRQRAWYYTHIYADPHDRETVYVLNVRFHKSVDGGRTFAQTIRVPHGDNHALWIDPADALRMINGNDGGANVSFNGGESWTGQTNQPTAQMYHGTPTEDFPYKVCGGQQDNSTICVPSRTDGGGITNADYHRVGGCESGFVTTRPDDTAISYAGCYGGQLTRYDTRNGQGRSIMVWPENPMGWGADSLRYRFQWTYPIVLSPHDPDVLYVGSQHVHRTIDEGQSWETISPDLTRNDKSKQSPSGGPITKDNTSVEYYGTVFAIAPSPHDANVIWTGSDDGRVHVTRDGGATWQDVTPGDLPEWSLISVIDVSPHAPGAAYVAATRYKLDDFAPYIYKTADYGRSWRRIVAGIPAGHFIRAVREDPDRRGLLYAGGEFGVYVSFDDGARWQSLRLNLPVVPIHDLAVHRRDLVASTHGRGFWILDDLTPLHQLDAAAVSAGLHLFAPRDAYRFLAGSPTVNGTEAAPNPPDGAVVHFYLAQAPEQGVTLEYLETDGTVIRTFSTDPEEPQDSLEVKVGLTRHAWDLRYPGISRFDGMILWAGRTSGPTVVPGDYQVRLTVGEWTATRPLRVLRDPRVDATQQDHAEQLAFLLRIRDRVSEANGAVERIRVIKEQLNGVTERSKEHASAEEIRTRATALTDALSAVEREIYQVQNRSPQDPLNFPIRLNNKLAALTGVVESADAKPTAQSYLVFDQLSNLLQAQLDQLARIVEQDVPAFNAFVREQDVPAVLLP